jgi:hypothetical protein
MHVVPDVPQGIRNYQYDPFSERLHVAVAESLLDAKLCTNSRLGPSYTILAPARRIPFAERPRIIGSRCPSEHLEQRWLPIMAEQKAYHWQASLFAGFAIGKRW